MKLTHSATLIFISVIMLSGCRTGSIVDISSQPFPLDHTDEISIEQIGDAIERACKRKRWVPYQKDRNTIIASVYTRGHSATVRIEFDASLYSIHYVDSKELRYSARWNRIHKRYNKWVDNLEQQILIELCKLSDDT